MEEFVSITRELVEDIPEESAYSVEISFIVDSYDRSVAKEFLNSINNFVNELNKEIEANTSEQK